MRLHSVLSWKTDAVTTKTRERLHVSFVNGSSFSYIISRRKSGYIPIICTTTASISSALIPVPVYLPFHVFFSTPPFRKACVPAGVVSVATISYNTGGILPRKFFFFSSILAKFSFSISQQFSLLFASVDTCPIFQSDRLILQCIFL